MRTYTEEEVIKAIKYACGYQKACDYQTAGGLLIQESDEDTLNNVSRLLDDLCDTDTNGSAEIVLSDIFQ